MFDSCRSRYVHCCVIEFLVQRSKIIVPHPVSSCGRAIHRMFRKARDCLDITFGFEGQKCLSFSRFRDAML
jgi:hypothetical protein